MHVTLKTLPKLIYFEIQINFFRRKKNSFLVEVKIDFNFSFPLTLFLNFIKTFVSKLRVLRIFFLPILFFDMNRFYRQYLHYKI